MSMAAYQRAAATVSTDRQREYQIVARVTADLLAAEESRDLQRMGTALHRNRELWTLFIVSCSDERNALPAELRAKLVSIGMWVRNYTSLAVRGEKPLAPLIEVNRSIMAGLAQSGAHATSEPAMAAGAARA